MFSISSHFSHMFGELPSTAMELGEVLGLHGLTMPTSKESDLLSLPNTKKSRMITHAASYSSPFLDEQKMLRFSKAAHTLPSGLEIGRVNEQTVLVHRAKRPFTPSQWMELEHQALIYKYLNAKAPIPSSLLISIGKGFRSSSNRISWRHPYPGFPTNADCDPEPGRCRRTDGKKWRCSKDAMADHKYCERHINRNRHRSRKPVENQPTKTAKETPPNAVSLSSPVSPDRLKKARVNNLQPGTVSYWTDTLNRALLDRDPANRTAEDRINMLKSANLQPTLPLFSQLKQHNDVEKFSSTLDCESISTNTTSSKPWESCNVERNKQISSPQLNQGYLRSVLQDFSRPKNEMVKSKKSKVSDSSPASSDFFLSSEVPTQEICKFSPLRLPQGIDSSQDDLHICSLPSNMKQLQEDCIPGPWGLSQGGPLAEILTNSKNTGKDSCKTQDLMAIYSTSRNK